MRSWTTGANWAWKATSRAACRGWITTNTCATTWPRWSAPRAGEVVAMNTLGVNLHLMMVSFYRPTAERPAILIEAGAFPTDRYAVESQVRFHGFDPATALIELESDEPNGLHLDWPPSNARWPSTVRASRW